MGHNQHFRVHLQTNVQEMHIPDPRQAAVRSPPARQSQPGSATAQALPKRSLENTKQSHLHPKIKLTKSLNRSRRTKSEHTVLINSAASSSQRRADPRPGAGGASRAPQRWPRGSPCPETSRWWRWGTGHPRYRIIEGSSLVPPPK